MKELCDNWEMQFEVGQVTGFTEENGQMTEVKVTGATASLAVFRPNTCSFSSACSPNSVRLRIGPDARKKTDRCGHGPLRNQHPRPFLLSAISTFIRAKKKLILSGFHECALAAFAASEYVYPEKTRSPAVHDQRARNCTKCSALKHRTSTNFSVTGPR